MTHMVFFQRIVGYWENAHACIGTMDPFQREEGQIDVGKLKRSSSRTTPRTLSLFSLSLSVYVTRKQTR